MMIKSNSLQPILDCFTLQPVRGVTQLSKYLNKSRVIIQKYLKVLLEQNMVRKEGLGAHARYMLVNEERQTNEKKATKEVPGEIVSFDYESIEFLDTYFLKYAVNGKRLTGKDGFVTWCKERKMDPSEKIKSFVTICKHIKIIRNSCGLIDVTKDFRSNIELSAIDELYYADQYKRMEFGRGKLAELTFYAKDSAKIAPIQEVIDMVKDKLECFLAHHHVDAIALTPHSKKRPIQLLTELKKGINTGSIPYIKLVKYAPYGMVIAQKTLKTREQRIQNARETILIENGQNLKKYNTVLLIDDFVGSGATLNETAKKLKQAGVKQVLAFAFVGNANLSYEVINEI